jgi:tetratricopeptide (TPR) repeat protein
LADFDKAIELDPANADAYAERGDWLRILRRGDRGKADLDQAISLNPKNSKELSYRASYHYEVDRDYEQALADANKALEIDPKYQRRKGLHLQRRGAPRRQQNRPACRNEQQPSRLRILRVSGPHPTGDAGNERLAQRWRAPDRRLPGEPLELGPGR